MKVSYLKDSKFRPKSVTTNMNYKKCGCDSRRTIPMFVIDQIADAKFSAGFDIKRRNQCSVCFEYKSANGTCSCS
jgi:hypothetical protein